MKRTTWWAAGIVAGCLVLVLVACMGPAIPGSAGGYVSQASNHHREPSGDAVVTPSPISSPSTSPELPVPAPSSIGVPSGVATAMPSELATLTATRSPKETPAPTPIGHILPPVVVAKGWATYQAGTGLWGSPSALVRSWGVGTVRVCGPLACRRIQLRNGCACGMRRGIHTLIDLAEPAWVVLCGDPSAGICRVEVSR